jgi:hypothetical protein
VERLERLSHAPARLKGLEEAWGELLLAVVGELEAIVAVWAWSSGRGKPADFLASSRSCRASGTRASGEVALASRILSWL